MLLEVQLAAFVDELEKVSASHGMTAVSKVRTGTRPISVTNLIKKHNAGTLFKKKHADSQGNPADVRGDSDDDPGAARERKRPGDVPSRDRGDIQESQKTGEQKGCQHCGSEKGYDRTYQRCTQCRKPYWKGSKGGHFRTGEPPPEEKAAADMQELHGRLARRFERLFARRPDLKKEAVWRLTDSTQPFTSGEEVAISAESRKPRQPGDVPTQGPEQAMIAPPSGGGISYGQAKAEALRGRKKGDVPTRDRDLNLVDRVDLREGTTTVPGLAQHSTDIGAFNSPVEHP